MPAPRKSVLANPNRPGAHQHAKPGSPSAVTARPGGSQPKAKSTGGAVKPRPGGSQPDCGC